MALDATALTSGAVTCATKPGAFGGIGLVLSLCEFRRADFGGWYGYCSMGFFWRWLSGYDSFERLLLLLGQAFVIWRGSKYRICPEAELTQLTHDKRVVASGANDS